jgi:hypothetical protein
MEARGVGEQVEVDGLSGVMALHQGLDPVRGRVGRGRVGDSARPGEPITVGPVWRLLGIASSDPEGQGMRNVHDWIASHPWTALYMIAVLVAAEAIGQVVR